MTQQTKIADLGPTAAEHKAEAATARRCRPGRYGMAFSTIRYWQGYARSINRYVGLWAGSGTFHLPASIFDHRAARDIGHDAIAAAAINAAGLRAIIQGEPRR